MNHLTRIALYTALTLPVSSFAFDFTQGSVPVSAGFLWSSQGSAQHIDITSLIGNDYTVTDGSTSTGLFGLGYFLNAYNNQDYQIDLGVNAFYLGNLKVNGIIVQESAFENLAYEYKIQNIPVYLAAKGRANMGNKLYDLTADFGIGPNFMKASGYTETVLQPGTLLDHAFISDSNTKLSVTAGLGVRFNNIFGKMPVEIGYRYFYLGKGELKKNNSQILENLSTGSVYANALVVTITA